VDGEFTGNLGEVLIRRAKPLPSLQRLSVTRRGRCNNVLYIGVCPQEEEAAAAME